MRLINNETVQTNISRHRTMAMIGAHEETEERMKGYNPSSFLTGFDYGMELACKLIANAPTVDAVPVVRGEWIVGSKPRCSICGKPALREYDRDDWLSYVPSNFCPNCGADMRKKVEE